VFNVKALHHESAFSIVRKCNAPQERIVRGKLFLRVSHLAFNFLLLGMGEFGFCGGRSDWAEKGKPFPE